jgi:hypothetical protein
MIWSPENRVLKVMKVECAFYLMPVCCCPEPIAGQAASLWYYHDEVSCLCFVGPGYFPPRLLRGNLPLNYSEWMAAGPAIIQAFVDITSNLMEYYHERDPVVLESLRRKCIDGLAGCGLEEVPGIMAAIRDIGNL